MEPSEDFDKVNGVPGLVCIEVDVDIGNTTGYPRVNGGS